VKSVRSIALVAQGGAGWAGGSEYIRNLARAIRTADSAVRIHLLHGAPQAAEWEPHRALFDSLVPVAVRGKKSFLDRWRAANRAFREAVETSGADFVYPLTYDNHYNVGVTFPIGLRQRWAGWIPDFQHRHLPRLFSEKEVNRRERGIRQLLEEAPTIVFSSESAAADFRRFYPEARNAVEVLTFATFPQADWYAPFGEEDLRWVPERFLIVCNQFWSHKNHALVVRALELLAARGVRPVIVCTGALVDFRDPAHVERLLQQVHRAGLGAQVMLLGLVSRRLQIELIRRSLAVIQPSLFEGWSTVVEDARVLGKPALLSDLDVHREQHPPGAQFFPREDAAALGDLLAAAWSNLDPGPDSTAEGVARACAEARIGEVGRRFLEIASR
jgi:glycosyltransferase involved in cell wall biosynthesis